MPYRERATPEAWPAAWPGVERRRMAATARADHRSQDEAQPREQDSEKKTASVEEHSHGAP